MSRFGIILVAGSGIAAVIVTLSVRHQEKAEPKTTPLPAKLLPVPFMTATLAPHPAPDAHQNKIDYGRAALLAYLGPPDPEIEDISTDNQEQCPKCSIRDILRSCYARSLPKLYGDVSSRVVVSGDVPDTEIGYLFRVPEGSRLSASCLLRECVESVYGIRGVREELQMDVLVLRRADPRGPQYAGEETITAIQGSHGSAKNLKMADLASWLARRVGKPVVDETRLERASAWEPIPKSSSLADLNAALAKLGLSLEHDRRKIDVVVVRKVGAQNHS